MQEHEVNKKRITQGKTPANIVLLRGCGSRSVLIHFLITISTVGPGSPVATCNILARMNRAIMLFAAGYECSLSKRGMPCRPA